MRGRREGPAGALKEKRRGLAEEGRGPGTGEDHEKSGQSIEGEGSQWRPFDREDDGFVFRTGEDRGEAEGERARVGLYPELAMEPEWVGRWRKTVERESVNSEQ